MQDEHVLLLTELVAQKECLENDFKKMDDMERLYCLAHLQHLAHQVGLDIEADNPDCLLDMLFTGYLWEYNELMAEIRVMIHSLNELIDKLISAAFLKETNQIHCWNWGIESDGDDFD